MTRYLTTTALILALALPSYAGGPVITEDTTETVAPQNDRKIGGIVVGIIAIAALMALANGGGACTVEETAPEPTPEPC
jgi:hypothetical protein